MACPTVVRNPSLDHAGRGGPSLSPSHWQTPSTVRDSESRPVRGPVAAHPDVRAGPARGFSAEAQPPLRATEEGHSVASDES